MIEKIPMTREGYEKLRRELEYLKTVKRRQIAEEIAKARAFGDLRENAEYEAAKSRQALNEKRIAEHQEKLSRVQILDDAELPTDQVLIGATVLLQDLNTQEKLRYQLVPQDEADFDQGRISVTSPIAQGLLGRKAGETTEIRIPAGTLKYKILKITR